MTTPSTSAQWKLVPVEPTIEMLASQTGYTAEGLKYDPLRQRDLKLKYERLLAASPSPAASPASPSGVRVKPLEWKEIEYDRGDGQTDTCGEWEATSIVGVYAVNISMCGDMHAPWEVFGGDDGKIGNFPTLDEAMTAAQSDFETRIRSALVSGSREDGDG